MGNGGVWLREAASPLGTLGSWLAPSVLGNRESITRDQDPFFAPFPFPGVSLLPGGMWGEQHGGLASQAASFFFFFSAEASV